MRQQRICHICGHLESNCTGGGLESEVEAHDFQASCILPETCHFCGEDLDPITKLVFVNENWCDAGLYCNENCRDAHFADIASGAIDDTDYLRDTLWSQR